MQSSNMGVAHNLVSSNIMDYIELSPNLGIVEVSIPRALIGKTLAETNLRAKFKINVVAIKRGEALIIPPLPSEKFKEDDVLVVVGGIKGIQRLEDLS
jgi:trk system potassium uptake protein TrkA